MPAIDVHSGATILHRRIIWILSIVNAFSMLPTAHAAGYPDRSVQLIAPSSPGGGVDTVARIIAQKLTEYFHQQIIVVNRPGAAGRIGGAELARAAPDGYTLLIAGSSFTSFPALYKDVPFDVARDLAPISQVITLSNVLISHPSLPVKTVKQLIAFGKAHPGQLAFASAGVGSNPHLAMELFLKMTGLNMIHVSYKGIGPGLIDVIAGEVSLMTPNILSALVHVRSGKVRAYGVTGAERSRALPDLPTIAESGVPGYEADQWYGLLAPAGTPRDVINKLSGNVARALRDPAIQKRFLNDAAVPVGNSPDEFAAVIGADLKKWTKVIKDAGIQAE